MANVASIFSYTLPPSEIDRLIRQKLAKSLAYVYEKSEQALAIDKHRAEAALQAIRSGRVDPGVFARYYDLVRAVSSGAFPEADKLVAEINALAVTPQTFEIVAFTSEELGEDISRFFRLLFAESRSVRPQGGPQTVDFHTMSSRLEEALQIIRGIDADIGQEIDALVHRLVLMEDEPNDGRASFGGVTSFMIWGALFMNVRAYNSRWDAVQFLVHEITHALIFGLGFDGPLVLNHPSENYPSPLRNDPRPMDGVYHATMVCGRLAYFNRRWLASPDILGDDRELSTAAMQENLEAFRRGAKTIAASARMSDMGRDLFEMSCRELLQ